jgi:hypothetical protein
MQQPPVQLLLQLQQGLLGSIPACEEQAVDQGVLSGGHKGRP